MAVRVYEWVAEDPLARDGRVVKCGEVGEALSALLAHPLWVSHVWALLDSEVDESLEWERRGEEVALSLAVVTLTVRVFGSKLFLRFAGDFSELLVSVARGGEAGGTVDAFASASVGSYGDVQEFLERVLEPELYRAGYVYPEPRRAVRESFAWALTRVVESVLDWALAPGSGSPAEAALANDCLRMECVERVLQCYPTVTHRGALNRLLRGRRGGRGPGPGAEGEERLSLVADLRGVLGVSSPGSAGASGE